MKRLITVFLAAVFMLQLLSGCERELTRFSKVYTDLFDTVTTVTGYAESYEEFSENAGKIYDELFTLYRLFDIYNAYDGINNLKTVNDSAGKEPVKVDRRIIDLLLRSKELYEKTEGAVNVAMGSVLTIWHKAREKGLEDPESAALPDEESLYKAAEHTDISKLVIDENARTVFLADGDMSLDVGAISKGYAGMAVRELLEKLSLGGYIISIGGNVTAAGKREDGEAFTVGVKDPWGESDYILTVEAQDVSVVTSGSYERYFTVEDRSYHHIIDPETLYPSARYVSVTVISKDDFLADGLSTALFNMELSEGIGLVESLTDTEALWITDSGERVCSGGFEAYMAEG